MPGAGQGTSAPRSSHTASHVGRRGAQRPVGPSSPRVLGAPCVVPVDRDFRHVRDGPPHPRPLRPPAARGRSGRRAMHARRRSPRRSGPTRRGRCRAGDDAACLQAQGNLVGDASAHTLPEQRQRPIEPRPQCRGDRVGHGSRRLMITSAEHRSLTASPIMGRRVQRRIERVLVQPNKALALKSGPLDVRADLVAAGVVETDFLDLLRPPCVPGVLRGRPSPKGGGAQSREDAVALCFLASPRPSLRAAGPMT